MFNWLKRKQPPVYVKEVKPPVVIGDWKSDVVETRKFGTTHYLANNLEGARTIIERASGRGRGGATLDYWEPGNTVRFSAYIPLEILKQLL